MLAQAAPDLSALPTGVWIAVAVVVLVVIIVLARTLGRRDGRTTRTAAVPTTRESARPRTATLTSLTPGARERYAESWRAIQARFVESPHEALRAAERLVSDVMRDRGYPHLEPAERGAALAGEGDGAANEYRAARAVVDRLDRGDKASTEDMRQALVGYRTVVERLVERPLSEPAPQ